MVRKCGWGFNSVSSIVVIIRAFSQAVILLAISFGVHSYTPEVGHKHIMPLSHMLLKECGHPAAGAYEDADIKLITETSAQMDTGQASTTFETDNDPFSLWSRAKNWHFYNPEIPEGQKYLGYFQKSYIKVWEWLKYGYNNAPLKEDRLTYLGGMAHFIEDMANPAHIIPVFHAIGIKDGIDDFEPDYQIIKDRITDQSLCNSVISEPVLPEPIDVRDWLVNQTMSELDNSPQDCPSIKWGEFFDLPEDKGFFGRFHENPDHKRAGFFGSLFKSKTFYISDTGLFVSNIDSSYTCQIDDKNFYQGFIDQLFENAIVADAKLLIGQAQYFIRDFK